MILLHLGHVPLQDHHHLDLLRVYAKRIPVLYLERCGGDPDRGEGSRHIAWTQALMGLPTAGLYRIPVLPALPGDRFGIVARWNWWLGVRRVVQRLKSLGAVEVVLLTQTPGLLPTLRGLGADLTVYQVIDDYAGLVPAASVRRTERAHHRMAKQAGVAWAISRPLTEELRRHRCDVHETTTGVNWEQFAAAGRLRPELSRLKPPRLGIVGVLNDRIDWQTMHEVASRRGDWQIVLVGPIQHAGPATGAWIEKLRRLSNVTLLPEAAPAEIPGHIASFDVALIPYLPGRGTLGINPLKLYQYLAAGRPVVATPLPAIQPFADLVALATGVDETIQAIERTLALPSSPEECSRRQERARRFDWSEVAAQRLELIRGHLDRRMSAHGDGPCTTQGA